MYFVYHIHTDKMCLSEGYVGVSCNPISRWKQHSQRKENPFLANAIEKYEVKYSILSQHETLEDALWQEFTLRPFERMGWNIVKGGGMPPAMGGWNKGKETPPKVRAKQSEARVGKYSGKEHPRSKLANIYSSEDDKLLAEAVVISVWAKENGYHQAHLASTARGKLRQHKGIYARYI